MGQRAQTPVCAADPFAAVMGARRGALHPEAAPDPRDDTRHPHAGLYGPHGDAVARLLDRALDPTVTEIRAVAKTKDRVSRQTLFGALDAAGDTARDAGRGAAWEAARDVVFAVSRGVVDIARKTFYAAAWNAAAALVVRDLISDEDYEALTHRWREVIGPLPE